MFLLTSTTENSNNQYNDQYVELVSLILRRYSLLSENDAAQNKKFRIIVLSGLLGSYCNILFCNSSQIKLL